MLYDDPDQTSTKIAQRCCVAKPTVTRFKRKYIQTNGVVDLPRLGSSATLEMNELLRVRKSKSVSNKWSLQQIIVINDL